MQGTDSGLSGSNMVIISTIYFTNSRSMKLDLTEPKYVFVLKAAGEELLVILEL